MIGWTRLKHSQLRTPYPNDLTLCIVYYLRRIGRFDMKLAVLLVFDCHLRVEDIQS